MPVACTRMEPSRGTIRYRFNSQIMYDLGGATVSTIASAIMQDAGMPQERLNEVIQAKRKLSYELIPTESKLLPTFDVVRHYYQQKPIALGSVRILIC